MLTEDEARQKWCPFYQVAAASGDPSIFESDNRPLDHIETTGEEERHKQRWEPTGKMHEAARCIASDCMAWRTKSEELFALPKNAEQRAEASADGYSPTDDPGTMKKVVDYGGYCGLAGKP